MSDPPPDDRANQSPASDPVRDALPASAPEPAQAVQRREFLRQLTGEAVVTSARLAGLSSAVRRSLFAAGEAATRDPDQAGQEPPPAMASGATAAVPVPPAPASGPPAATGGPAAPSAPATPVPLAPQQEALLTHATTAVLGTNDPAGAPQLTSSTFHWDGSTVRIPSELFAARVARIDADPRVSVLVASDASDGWVAISGTASIVSGDAVEAEMMTVLRKHMTDHEADRTWTEMRASGDPVVIVVRPSRYVWRLDRE